MSRQLAAMLTLLVLAPCAGAASSAKARILALEKTWMHAARTRDVPVLKRVLAADYVDINYKGLVRTRADALRASNVDTARYTQRFGDETVRVYGAAAVVTGRGELQASDHTVVAAWRFTDVFVKRGGVWRAVSSQETVERH